MDILNVFPLSFKCRFITSYIVLCTISIYFLSLKRELLNFQYPFPLPCSKHLVAIE